MQKIYVNLLCNWPTFKIKLSYAGLSKTGVPFETNHPSMTKQLSRLIPLPLTSAQQAQGRLLAIVFTLFFACLSGVKSEAQEEPVHRAGSVEYRGYSYNSRSGMAAPTVRQYVMGPLEQVTDWESFSKALRQLKQNGIEAITTDVWWGSVEAEKGRFQWDYYKRYVEVVRAAGLKWLPILSFHQAGGNVGDTVDIPIPKWVWNESTDMKFVGSNGVVNGEYISFWTPEAYPLYERVMKSFSKKFCSIQFDHRENLFEPRTCWRAPLSFLQCGRRLELS
jgi:hypothetical protein